MDLSAEALADRVNCYGIGVWLGALSDKGGVPFQLPLDAKRRRLEVNLVTLGIGATIFRHGDAGLSEADQVVLNRVHFDPKRARLPFGLDARTVTPNGARLLLSEDTAGGRAPDLGRGDTRMSFFLPDDARVVALRFNHDLVGITACSVFRLGGEIDYRDVERLFGRRRLGVP